jgi:hypothetical protein
MVAELDARYGGAAADRVQNVALRAGAVEVDAEVTIGGHRLVRAEFHTVSDSARAAVELARALLAVAAAPPAGGAAAGPGPGLRMALCTGPHTAGGGAGPDPWLCAGAAALVERAEPGEILATEATAVMVGGSLPPGVDLVDRGSRSLGPGRASERVYELRIDGLDGGDGDDRPAGGAAGDAGVAPSNLGWARRAVGGLHDDVAHELDGALHTLTAAWRAALAGERRTVLLSSRERACKARLAAELALRLHADGALVLYGRWDPDVTAPYQGIREAFGVYADGCGVEQLRADLEGWGDEVARLLPDVGARIGGPGAAVLPAPGDERTRLFDAVEAWLAALARRRPTLLVLDDVHWAEPSSLLLLDHLHHASAGIPLLIVASVGADDDDATGGSPRWPDPVAAPDVLAHAEPGEVERIDLDH